eukprot:c7082_g1_i1.p1 GENE.c7082_g1_i1~~c7082_g1_i1.p1  ORF type:complete len:117 (+),score=18.65 c7082_g1_i1:776-1126(+)
MPCSSSSVLMCITRLCVSRPSSSTPQECEMNTSVGGLCCRLGGREGVKCKSWKVFCSSLLLQSDDDCEKSWNHAPIRRLKTYAVSCGQSKAEHESFDTASATLAILCAAVRFCSAT